LPAQRAVNASEVTDSPVPVVVNLIFTLAWPAVPVHVHAPNEKRDVEVLELLEANLSTATAPTGIAKVVASASNVPSPDVDTIPPALSVASTVNRPALATPISWNIHCAEPVDPVKDFDLNDAYGADLDPGNVVITATNGAILNYGLTTGATPVAGTASTVVYAGSPSSDVVRIDQPTAGAPLTTTVTISFNGTTVCTKTVSIRGKVTKLAIANVGTQSLTGSTGSTQWMFQEIGVANAGLFTVLATDSAGGIVSTSGLGTFEADATTLAIPVGAVAVDRLASSNSSTSTSRFSLGAWTCTGTAGQASVKIKFTTTGTGESVTSDAFTARCAGNPDTYTVALDKAAYNVGDLATATVQFLDSRGNKANSVTAVGANSWTLPFMTGVTFTITDGASATSVTKTDGSVAYTFTVGTTTAVTPGTYTGVVSYSVPAAGVKATPTYKISTGGDTTTNADVLKSIVALIASINKQIQALQKLILKR